MMSDKIILTGIEVFGRHGCSDEEQTLGQYFKVDVELDTDLSKAGRSDNIGDTVNYAKVLFLIEEIVAGSPRRLIETVAENIAAEILNRFDKVTRVKVILHKPNAPLPVKYADAAVEIVRDREK